MARPLDLRQQRELTAFVNALYEAADYKTTAQWAMDSGYPAPNLSNLRNEKGGVDGYNLFRLIRAAAARAELEPAELAIRLEQAIDAGSALASIDGRLRVLSDLVAKALELLESQGEQSERGDEQTDRRSAR